VEKMGKLHPKGKAGLPTHSSKMAHHHKNQLVASMLIQENQGGGKQMITKDKWEKLLKKKMELQAGERQNENDKQALRKLSTKVRSQAQKIGSAKDELIAELK
jgi:hypothetical protein